MIRTKWLNDKCYDCLQFDGRNYKECEDFLNGNYDHTLNYPNVKHSSGYINRVDKSDWIVKFDKNRYKIFDDESFRKIFKSLY